MEADDMAEGSDPDSDLEPEAAFALIGQEMRFAILRALWDAGDKGLTFSELREAVGNPDAGNFNYHLRRLLGPFVVKHETDGSPTYELTVAAGYVMGSIESGGYHRTERVGPVGIDGTCPDCGGGIEAVYEDDLACVRCLECDVRMFDFPLPAGAVAAYDPPDLPDLLDRWVRTTVRRVRANICPVCSGRLSGHLTDEDSDHPAKDITARYTCQQCARTVNGTVSAWLVEHPAVVQFWMNHAVDPLEHPLWSEMWRTSTDVRRLETDPLRVGVQFTLDGETLELVVDETVQVAEVRRP
ncbi:winged helix-turn-helix domain-containing protein [Haloarchaeobius baliensis]|uniref:winged helix-turn-helix domain-containing protein n=1 Tax=Haloarchaeobius baliensis TaxID=1670458 RepID=UPI003F881F71